MHDATNITLNLLDTNREPITGPLGDVTSNAFTTSIGINPLIAAAMPLLSQVSEIEQRQDTVNSQRLFEELQHEIKAFENSAHINGYRSQMILAARYLLCALLDEFITAYHPQLNWEQHSLLGFFQHETWGGERFFIILERSCEDPACYTDLLELGYVCLSLGYQGKYTGPTQLRELGHFIDQLYQIIEKQRGEQQPTLTCNLNTTKKSRWRLPPWWVVAISCGMILGGIFIPYSLQLNKAIKPLIYNINHYEQ